ncbi:MAG: EXLDI protein [Firmicutes bacterium]|nr:EXLDI protein [Bacillota bacterium]
MPNKTIYVAEEDLPLLEQAQALAGGNLSAAVARALRRFVAAESARQQGFEEVTVVVGPPGSRRKKRFFGYRLARWQHQHADGDMIEVFSVYRTKGGRYAVHRRIEPNWAMWADPEWWSDPERWNNPKRWHAGRWGASWSLGQWGRKGDATLEVFDTLEELQQHVPPELFEILKEAGQEPPLEDLDI